MYVFHFDGIQIVFSCWSQVFEHRFGKQQHPIFDEMQCDDEEAGLVSKTIHWQLVAAFESALILYSLKVQQLTQILGHKNNTNHFRNLGYRFSCVSKY